MKNEDKEAHSLRISKKKIAEIQNNPQKIAKAAHLIYVSDESDPCIRRKKHGKYFRYFVDGKPLKDKQAKERIKKLVIPPAWENVWICIEENGHLQATGYDSKGRKQYLYHPAWVELRNQSKFHRMMEFAQSLPAIRMQVEKDLSSRKLSQQKVLATIVCLMERTNIRVGNNIYEKLYGSYGLTTLKDKHINIKGSTLNFAFKGKKGVYRDVSLRNARLARIVQQCKEIPGKELFQYYGEDGKRHSIDSGMVNDYIRDITGEDFSAKDFRTWAGTVNAFMALKELGCGETQREIRKNLVQALDQVAKQLGNTRAVCKKYYVHPLIMKLYETGELSDYYEELDLMETGRHKADLTCEEKVILSILEKHK